MFRNGLKFLVIFRFIYSFKIKRSDIVELNPDLKEPELMEIISTLNPGGNEEYTKKERYKTLSDIFQLLDGSFTSPDSLRKWFASRTIECLNLMNGNPPRSAYSIETLQILVEKNEILKIVD